MPSDLFIAAVAAVVVRGDRLLAMRRAPHKDAGAGLWETLSGRLDAGEQPDAAIAREIMEESGLETRLDPRPIDAYVAMRGAASMMLVVYRAEWIAGEVRRSAEHDADAWLTLDEFAARTTLDRLVVAARRAFA